VNDPSLYLLLWGPLSPSNEGWDIERKRVLDYLDSWSDILAWFTCFRDAVLVVSPRTANEIAETFHRRFLAAHFVVFPLSDPQAGYLPRDAWKFIYANRPPKPSPDDASVSAGTN